QVPGTRCGLVRLLLNHPRLRPLTDVEFRPGLELPRAFAAPLRVVVGRLQPFRRRPLGILPVVPLRVALVRRALRPGFCPERLGPLQIVPGVGPPALVWRFPSRSLEALDRRLQRLDISLAGLADQAVAEVVQGPPAALGRDIGIAQGPAEAEFGPPE